MKLKLAEDLALPADEAVTQKYGFIGRSGSGKSYAAMRLAELFLDHGAQIIALDWVGIWWSLRLAADGKTPGFAHVYIFGGEHADVELRPESGALMADLVVDKHISVVLDVMHFRKAERTRFATAFAEQFFHRKKTARTACHLFIEEAQAYLPQLVRGDEARMVGVFEDIGKVGRNYGIGTSLISQRPQAINKDVLNQVEVLLAFQTNGPQERKAIAGWTAENTDAGAAMVQELPKLHVGDALVWSPQWLRVAKPVHIGQRRTYDASSTPTQKAKAIRPKTLAPADLAQLGEQITATIEKAKADDPRELRKAIAEKDRRIKDLEKATSGFATSHEKAKPEVKVVEKFVLKDGQLARAEKLIDRGDKLADTFHRLVDTAGPLLKLVQDISGVEEDFRTTAKEIRDAIARTVAPPPNTHATMTQRADAPRRAPVMSTHARRVAPVVATSRPAPVVADDGAPGDPERRILESLAWWEAAGVPQPTREQTAFVARYSVNGHFNNTLGTMRTKGWVDYPAGNHVALTADGRGLTTGPETAPSREELIARTLAVLRDEPQRRLFTNLVEADEPELSREDLAARSRYTVNGHFNNTLGRLRTLGLVVYPRGNAVALSPLFDALP